MNPLLESIINLRNASRGAQPAMQMNHTLQTTFGGPLEASARNMINMGHDSKSTQLSCQTARTTLFV